MQFSTRHGTTYAVQDVSLELKAGEVLGLVGESGAGKSTIGNAIIDFLDLPGRVAGGEILFQDRNLRGSSEEQMRDVRGEKIGMIFQYLQTSLSPLMTIGAQLVETIIKATNLRETAAVGKAIDLLISVGITETELLLKSYLCQFLGGIRQRVVAGSRPRSDHCRRANHLA